MADRGPEPGKPGISVVTPTLGRPQEVEELLRHLVDQSLPPREVILVDGAGPDDERTRQVVERLAPELPWPCRYIRHGGGTAIQRNVGIDAAGGDLIALVDDDIRLEEDFLQQMRAVFEADEEAKIGGVTGYITNQHLDPATSRRWRWNRRLRLFSTYEPGRYDYETGYPINRYLRPPHDDLVEIDFMGAGCAVWRREVFDEGLRFAAFFTGYAVLEDAHFALRAGRRWQLKENGKARCVHLRSPNARPDTRRIGRQSAVNYRYVFLEAVPQRTWRQETRFWTVQIVDLLRFLAVLLIRRDRDSLNLVRGKLEGLIKAARLSANGPS